MARKHKLDEVLISLSKKKDVRITASKEILVLTGESKRHPKNHDLGNSSWGKISFLIRYCGYRLFRVDNF